MARTPGHGGNGLRAGVWSWYTPLPGERRRPGAVTAGVVTATAQRTPDQQRQQQGDDAGQHHDDACDAQIKAVDERCGEGKTQDRPGRDQSDPDAGGHYRPAAHGLDRARPVHRNQLLSQ